MQGVRRRQRCCEHSRSRSQCKECGGSSFCEHGRQRTQCKECGGSSICEHGRQRAQCKECGGKECGVWSYESTSMEEKYRKTGSLERASGLFEAKMLHFWAAGWGEIGQKKPL